MRNGFEIIPFVKTEAEGDLNNILIHLVKYDLNPKWIEEVKREDQSALSKTFSALSECGLVSVY